MCTTGTSRAATAGARRASLGDRLGSLGRLGRGGGRVELQTLTRRATTWSGELGACGGRAVHGRGETRGARLGGAGAGGRGESRARLGDAVRSSGPRAGGPNDLLCWDPVCFKPLARRGGAGLARNVKSDTVHAQITPLSLDIR